MVAVPPGEHCICTVQREIESDAQKGSLRGKKDIFIPLFLVCASQVRLYVRTKLKFINLHVVQSVATLTTATGGIKAARVMPEIYTFVAPSVNENSTAPNSSYTCNKDG